MIRVCALVLAMALLFTCPIVALADESTLLEAPGAPQSEAEIFSGESAIDFSPVTDSGSTTPDGVTDKRPAFMVTQEPVYPNWRLRATLLEVVPGTVEYITPYYSFDGETFTAGERLSYTHFSEFTIEPDVEPMNSFTEGLKEEFWLYLQIEGTDYNGPSQTCKVLRNMKKPTLPTPELDKITAKVEHVATGWRLSVTLPYSVRIGAKLIFPEYSLDGTSFSPATDAYGDPVIWDDIDQKAYDERDRQSLGARLQPMKGFVGKEYDKFYFRMNIEGDNYNGYSDVYVIERTLEPQPIPQNTEILASLPKSSNEGNRGLFHVTVREGASRDTLLSYLPTALPVRWTLQHLPGTPHTYIETDSILYGVNWNLPQGLPQNGIFKDCIELVPPTDEMIFHGVLANYNIPQSPRVQISAPADPNDPGGEWIDKDMPFDLAINVIPANEKMVPQFGLTSWNGFDEDILAFSLPNKPSGATSIVAEYSLDGGANWLRVERTDGNNLVALGYSPDMVPKQPDYGAPLFFDNDKTPMKEYLADNSKGFLVRLQIDGGVYDGASEVLPWPGDYQFHPPATIKPGPSDGGGGNRGDVGSDDDGDSAIIGGQRPDLPTAENPPETAAQTNLLAPLTLLAKTPDPTPTQTPDGEMSSAQPIPASSAPAQDSSESSFAPESAREAIAPPTETETQRRTDKSWIVPVVAAVALLGGGAVFAGLSSAKGAGRMSGFLKTIKAFFHK